MGMHAENFYREIQRRRSESNRRVADLQSAALPLGHGAGGRKLSRRLTCYKRDSCIPAPPWLPRAQDRINVVESSFGFSPTASTTRHTSTGSATTSGKRMSDGQISSA